MKRYLVFVLVFVMAVPALASAATRAPAPIAAPSEGEAVHIAALRPAPLIIDHTSTDITAVPQAAVEAAKATLHIAYGHTSHGSQLTTGMSGLVGFANGGGLGLALPQDIFAWNETGADGALDLDDYAMGGDVGYYPAWVNNTRTYLGDPDPATGRGTSHSDVNVIIWSWCGQASGYTEQQMLDQYLLPMTQLELDYPGITFIYMTGHSDGTGETGNLHLRNQQIRQYVIANNKVLFDFYDIELYDPDGAYYGDKRVNDECYYDSDGDGSRDKNWAIDWQGTHTQNVDWYSCSCAHSQPLNCNRKAYAAWWLWARLAGWEGPSEGTRYVAPDGNCNGHTPCYNDIQTAMSAAQDGEKILVATGVYTNISASGGVTPVLYLDKSVTLQGGYSADFSTWDPAAYPTTLDARGQGPVLSVASGISPTIAGLRITGGSATNSVCGGICVSGATVSISHCHVFSNSATGIFLDHSHAVLAGNTIVSNTTDMLGIGGGVAAGYSDVTLTGNVISANSAHFGGGLAMGEGSYVLNNNTISGNTAGDAGGGLYLDEGSAELEGNVISANSAALSGGGLLVMRGSVITLSHNTLSNNTAGVAGGGLILQDHCTATLDANMISANSAYVGGGLLLFTSTAASTNDVIVDNRGRDGSGVYIAGSVAHLLHTTIARNGLASRRTPSADGQGSGVYVDSDPGSLYSSVLMTNTILVSHAVGISVTGSNAVAVNGVLWHDTPITVWQSPTATVVVQNQHNGDPAFAADGYHLTGSSAAIDAGVASGVTGDEASHDIDGEPRIDGRPDLGADEVLAALEVTKQATPDPVPPGGQLVYTIRITNTGVVTLHATLTDTLPNQVLAGATPGGTAFVPGGTVVWGNLTIAPGATWTGSFSVTLASGYFGSLTNTAQVTSFEGASGSASAVSVVGARLYLPVILRNA